MKWIERCISESQLPDGWKLTVNPMASMTADDWKHAAMLDASGTFDFWLGEKDIYDREHYGTH